MRPIERQVSGLALVVAALMVQFAAAADVTRGYQPKVKAAEATRLDWVYPLANQSVLAPPADWLKGYNLADVEYERFLPPGGTAKKPLPMILFISPGVQPAGWSSWGPVCRKAGVIFASPLSAGNNRPTPERVRVVLDVLDDVRRLVPIDPDRTYIAGFSGGGRIASSIATALPELFGGAIPVCAGAELREESWLRQRAVDRLSFALITGETDFNRGEVERWRGPLLAEVGVRARVWTVPKLGHGIPNETVCAEILRWLDEGVADRVKQAARWPAMRIAAGAAPSRTEWAQNLFMEAQSRLEKPETLYSGLMQLQGLRVRWADLPAADAATKILTEYDSRDQRPWEADDIAEQRRYLIAGARSLDAYASGELPAQYAKQRSGMIQAAIGMWQQVLADNPDSPAGKEAAKRIPELQKLTE